MSTNTDKVALDVIQLLLNANAHVNIQCRRNIVLYTRQDYITCGDTALHIAVRDRKIQFISILLECNPNLSLCNENNETAYDITKKHKSYEIMELIEKELRQQIFKYLLYRWIRQLRKIPSPPTITIPKNNKRRNYLQPSSFLF